MSSRVHTADDMLRLAGQGETELVVGPGELVTPLARDVARDKGVRIVASVPVPEAAGPQPHTPRPHHVAGVNVMPLKPSPVELHRPEMDVQLTNVVTTEHGMPMAAGVMSLRQGSFGWTLNYDEVEYVIEGELHITTEQQRGIEQARATSSPSRRGHGSRSELPHGPGSSTSPTRRTGVAARDTAIRSPAQAGRDPGRGDGCARAGAGGGAAHRAPYPDQGRCRPAGTAYTVLIALDEQDRALTGAYEFADVVRDGVVTDFAGAIDLVRRLKQKVEAHLGVSIPAAHGAYPPGVPLSEVRAVLHVIEAAEMECSGLVDEPSAANAVLGLGDTGSWSTLAAGRPASPWCATGPSCTPPTRRPVARASVGHSGRAQHLVRGR